MRKYVIALFAAGLILPGLYAQEVLDKSGTRHERKIRHYEKSMVINGSPEEVFAFMDDINNTGMHMTKSNAAMMGGKLHIAWLTDHQMGLGAKYRWTGKILGMKMDFTVEVNKWVKNREKQWGTVGDARMIVIDWFEMYLAVSPGADDKTGVKLGISYTKHKGFLGFLLGKAYSKWCVKSMLKDTKKHFEGKKNEGRGAATP